MFSLITNLEDVFTNWLMLKDILGEHIFHGPSQVAKVQPGPRQPNLSTIRWGPTAPHHRPDSWASCSGTFLSHIVVRCYSISWSAIPVVFSDLGNHLFWTRKLMVQSILESMSILDIFQMSSNRHLNSCSKGPVSGANSKIFLFVSPHQHSTIDTWSWLSHSKVHKFCACNPQVPSSAYSADDVLSYMRVTPTGLFTLSAQKPASYGGISIAPEHRPKRGWVLILP